MSAFRADPSVKGIAAAALADCAPDACSAGFGGCEEILPMRRIWASTGSTWLCQERRSLQRCCCLRSLATAVSSFGCGRPGVTASCCT
jgi:hypothetical protein